MDGAFPEQVGLGCIKTQAGKQHPPHTMTLTSAPVWVTEKRKWEPNHPFPFQVTFGDVILITAIGRKQTKVEGLGLQATNSALLGRAVVNIYFCPTNQVLTHSCKCKQCCLKLILAF